MRQFVTCTLNQCLEYWCTRTVMPWQANGVCCRRHPDKLALMLFQLGETALHSSSFRLCFCCAGEYQESLRAGISAALARLRDYDTDSREGLSQELAQAAEFLDQSARLAMAAMLQVQGRAAV